MSNRLIHMVAVIGALMRVSCSAPVIGAEAHGGAKGRRAPDYLSGDEARSASLYRDVLPTVVTIFTEKKVIQKENQVQQQSLGSGVIVSAENHVLTAAHVVQGANVILVKTSDGKKRPAKLLFSEVSADIALLQFITIEPERPHAKIGDSDRLAVGQMAFAIGSPYGLENSFSVGYISGFHEFNRLYDGTIKAEFIQTDAAINIGNSGGPIFNSQAEVIGIASRIITQSGGFQGLGFVVAINTAKQLMALEDRVWMGIASSIITQSGGFQGLGLVVAINTAKQLMALEDRVWLGIEGVFLNRQVIATIMNHDLEGGLLIERVAKGSPADKAGLRGGAFAGRLMGREFLLGGDLIIQFNTHEICHLECLIEAKKHLSGIDKIPVTYMREGIEITTVIDVSQSRRNFLKK